MKKKILHHLQYFIFITEYSKCDVHLCLMIRGFKQNCNHVSYAQTYDKLRTFICSSSQHKKTILYADLWIELSLPNISVK